MLQGTFILTFVSIHPVVSEDDDFQIWKYKIQEKISEIHDSIIRQRIFMKISAC